MADINTLGLIAMTVRFVGAVFFGIVLITQVRLRLNKYDDELNHLRDLLIALTLVPFLFNFLAIYNNFIRFANGQQSELLNNASFILGAVASTATAATLWLIYRKK